MTTASQSAAFQRLGEISAALDDDERHIIGLMVEQRWGLLTTARAMRLRKEEALELLRCALDKVQVTYALIDARAERTAGRMQ